MIKVSDLVFKFVEKIGIKDVFLLSGGGAMHLVDSLGKNGNLNYVCCLHEQVAAVAAGSYSLFNNDYGVALVTTGPGGTNAVTGVAAAWVDSIPMMVISGQVKRADIASQNSGGPRTLGYQELDIISIVKPITKYAVTVMDPLEISYHLEKAYYLSRTGRPGPVWIDIPLDVQASVIDEAHLKHFIASENTMISEEALKGDWVEQFFHLLGSSSRPVIIAGYGIKLSRAEEEFFRFINSFKIPVLTTWRAADLIEEGHPHYFGRPGCIGQRGANFIQQNADLLISMGARLDFGQIGYAHETFAREARKVIIDIDPSEVGKFKFSIDLRIVGNLKSVIQQLNQSNQSNQSKNLKSSAFNDVSINKWRNYCKSLHQKYPIVLASHWQQTDYVSTYALLDVLSDELGNDDIIIPGSSGACAEVTLQAFRIKKGQRLIFMPGLGSMGLGLPCALGISAACRRKGERRFVCINGDGGFQLNIQDLETISRLQLPIKFFILNNDGYGSIKTTQRNYFGGHYVASDPSSGLSIPPLAKIADTYRFEFFRAVNNLDLKDIVKKVLECSGPALCEIMVHPEEATMPKLSSYIKSDGTMASKPLEDLWPFLPREEFRSNMLVKPIDE